MLAVLLSSEIDALERAAQSGPRQTYEDTRRRAQGLQAAGRVTLVAGAVLAGAGALTLWMAPDNSSQRVGFQAQGDSLGVVWAGRF